jgi:hypothetical protein
VARNRRSGRVGATPGFRGLRTAIRAHESEGREVPPVSGQLRDALQRDDRKMLAAGMMLQLEFENGSGSATNERVRAAQTAIDVATRVVAQTSARGARATAGRRSGSVHGDERYPGDRRAHATAEKAWHSAIPTESVGL